MKHNERSEFSQLLATFAVHRYRKRVYKKYFNTLCQILGTFYLEIS